jgi:hypothetical protein
LAPMPAAEQILHQHQTKTLLLRTHQMNWGLKYHLRGLSHFSSKWFRVSTRFHDTESRFHYPICEMFRTFFTCYLVQ